MYDKYKEVFEEMVTLVPTMNISELKKIGDGRLKFPIYLNSKLHETDIEALELSVRSSNCLHRAGFSTIGDLVESIDSFDDLRKIRNCGEKSIKEIMQKLFCYQYSQLDTTKKIKYINKILALN